MDQIAQGMCAVRSVLNLSFGSLLPFSIWLLINTSLWNYNFRIFVLLCLHQASWTVHSLEVIVLTNTSLQHLIRWGSCYWKKWWCTLEDAQFWGMDIILSCLIWYFICPFIFSVISPASMLWLYNFVKYCPLMAKKPLSQKSLILFQSGWNILARMIYWTIWSL